MRWRAVASATRSGRRRVRLGGGPRWPRIRTFLLAALCIASLGLAGWAGMQWRRPGNDAGYMPFQPITFSHRLHTAELEIDCAYCHSFADTDRYAGMPTGETCMNCHRFVNAPSQAVRDEVWAAAREGRDVRRVVSEEMRKLYLSQGLDTDLEPIQGVDPVPIEWRRVTRFPDFAYFDHRAHSRVGVECATCHGQVQTFERTRQAFDLSMGFCVACHRDSNLTGIDGVPVEASVDCVSCHR